MNAKVLLVFYNEKSTVWKRVEEIINTYTPSDIEIQFIDTENNVEILKDYGITSKITPYIVLLDNGVEISRDYGALTADYFKRFISV